MKSKNAACLLTALVMALTLLPLTAASVSADEAVSGSPLNGAAAPEAVFTATGPDSGTLSGARDCRYQFIREGEADGEIILSHYREADITGLDAGTIYIRSVYQYPEDEPQVIAITKAGTPELTVSGRSIPTTADHEYSLDDETFTACDGPLAELPTGVYYVRVKPAGTCLASESQRLFVLSQEEWAGPAYSWSEDCSEVTAIRMRLDENGGEVTETETVTTTSEVTKQPSCTIPGQTTYTAVFANEAFGTQVKTVADIDPPGHNFRFIYTWLPQNGSPYRGVIAEAECQKCGGEINGQSTASRIVTIKEPTCTEKGTRKYTFYIDEPVFPPQTRTVTDIPALGHDFSEAVYTWAADFSSVSAENTCSRCRETASETAAVTPVVTAPTCTERGQTTCTAVFENTGFETQTKITDITDALGHDWGEPTYTWAADQTQVTAERMCGRCDEKETEIVDTSQTVLREATTEEAGEMLVTASFNNKAFETQSKTVEIPKLDPPQTLKGWVRLAGSNRFKTMAAVTLAGFGNETCSRLIVTTGRNYADALAAAGLAGMWDCPIILTEPDQMKNATVGEVGRLCGGSTQIYILGDTAAVSKGVEDHLNMFGNGAAKRIMGSNRIKTAVEIYKAGSEWSDTCFLAYGYNFADALAISPYAYASRSAIFLTDKKGHIPAGERACFDDFNKVIILGSTAAVSDAAEAELRNAGKTVMRLAGPNRYATGAEIVKWESGLAGGAIAPAVTMDLQTMVVASGENYPDALVSVNLAGRHHLALMLAAEKTKAKKYIDEIIGAHTAGGFILGGEPAVSAKVEGWLNKAVE